LYEKGINTFNSNYSPNANGTVYINFNYNSLSEENKKILAQAMQEKPNNYFINTSFSSYCTMGENGVIDEERNMEVIFGIQKLTGKETYDELQMKMSELSAIFKKQIYMQGVFTREDVIGNKHNKLSNMANLGKKYIKQTTATQEESNEQIAQKENLLYSKKYDLFFENQESKSRYIESLYRKENDDRSESQIAQQAGCYYSEEKGMFFESEREYKQYEVLPTDFAKASKVYKIGEKIINRFKQMMSQIKDMWR